MITAMLLAVGLNTAQEIPPGSTVGRVFQGFIFLKPELGSDDNPIIPDEAERLTGLTLPEVIKQVEPEYSPEAGKLRLPGEVIITAVVKRDGTIGNPKVFSSTNDMLNESALQAVKQWTYKTALQNGKPVAVYHVVRVEFKPEHNK